MRRKVLFSFLLAASMSASAQLSVEKGGKTIIGKLPENLVDNNDLNNEITVQIFGKGPSGAGGKLSFGDYGRREKWGSNVYIGEYSLKHIDENAEEDTDQLWLHGKNGIYMTDDNATNAPLGYFDYKLSRRFNFNVGVSAKSLTLMADENQFSEVKELGKQLEKIQEINCLNYKMSDHPSAVVDARSDSRSYYGISAQELKTIYPNLVEENNGILTIDYIGLVPVLINAIKELNEKVNELEKKQAGSAGDHYTEEQANLAAPATAVLKQNAPNPFSTETIIEYYVPSTANNASVIVYDMNGTQLKEYKVAADGKGNVVINASELYAGMFMYALVVDGQLIDSKRMVLTK